MNWVYANGILFLQMLQIKYKKINTEFQYPFTTAYGQKTHQPALLIALSYHTATGFGEAPAITYYNITVEQMIDDLLSKVDMLQRYSFTEPERFWHFCHHLFPDNSFLVCALDMAYWDLYAKIKHRKIYELWNLKWENTPFTDYTVGIDTLDKMMEKIKAHPNPIYKIKVSGADDLEKLKHISNHTNATIRIDANASWDLEYARSILPQLEAMNIELIEQPLANDKYEETNTLRSQTEIPIIADESCVSEHDVLKCSEHFDGINIKLTKCGGITPAYRMIQQARKLNIKVMMGCMSETETGSYAIAQFLPLLDYVDMDGPLLLKTPPLKLLNYTDGKVILV